ncbi:hypothetical protein [Flavobacterium sp.]|jgi:hypothetical protein|uniref:hypothetical protein n=1 Tax=Flavobacterium sp. TaxID=239 RepID=UPI0037BFFD3E
MNVIKNRSFLIIILAAIFGFIIHKTIAHFLIPKGFEDNFIYSTLLLYGIFGLLSFVIVFLLIKVKKTSVDYVGYAFLAATTLKMVIAYALLRPIIQIQLPKTPAEKISFFVIFIYFLAIETILTIRILNNKQ